MAKFTRILSIDGGGMRGIIPAQVLVSFEEKLKKRTGKGDARLADYFDLIAGTSAGGILTCIYLCPDNVKNPNRPRFSAQDAVDFYCENGRVIFEQFFWQKVKSLDGLINEKYSSRNLEKFLERYFENLKLSDLLKPCLIPSYEIEKRKAHFFTQHDAKSDRKQDYWVRDVARATSAAPTFFSAARIASLAQEKFALVDGGVFANNPTLCAYAEVRHKFKIPEVRTDSGPTAKEMVILSLGTGDVKREYPYELAKDWGKIQWVVPLLNIIMTGVAETVDYQVSQIFDAIDRPKQYLRINRVLDKDQPLPIDDASEENLAALIAMGHEQAEKYSEELDRLIELLLEE